MLHGRLNDIFWSNPDCAKVTQALIAFLKERYILKGEGQEKAKIETPVRQVNPNLWQVLLT